MPVFAPMFWPLGDMVNMSFFILPCGGGLSTDKSSLATDYDRA